jgi:hypothetical protein
MKILKLAFLGSLRIAFFGALKAALFAYILFLPDTTLASSESEGGRPYRRHSLLCAAGKQRPRDIGEAGPNAFGHPR